MSEELEKIIQNLEEVNAILEKSIKRQEKVVYFLSIFLGGYVGFMLGLIIGAAL